MGEAGEMVILQVMQLDNQSVHQCLPSMIIAYLGVGNSGQKTHTRCIDEILYPKIKIMSVGVQLPPKKTFHHKGGLVSHIEYESMSVGIA